MNRHLYLREGPKSSRLQKSLSQLIGLVEAHDVAGILTVMGKADGSMAFSVSPQPVQQSMREYLAQNKSPVERACELGHLDILNLFLINGCSPNLPTSQGRLIHSVLTKLKSDSDLVDSGRALVTLRLMLNSHCDVNVKDYNRKSTLMLASELADPHILKVLLRQCSAWQLRYAARGCRLTPLHMTCMRSNVDCVRILLKRLCRADVNASDGRHTPLMCALKVLRHHLVYIDDIADAKGPKNAQCKIQYSLIAVIELLLHAGADPNAEMCLSEQNSNPFDLPILDAMDMANIFESRGREPQTSPRKLCSPYANLVRLLAFSGAKPFQQIDAAVLKEKLPNAVTLVDELKEFESCPAQKPKSLLIHARKTIRLRAARCNKLHQIQNLPLPVKLLDYSMFFDL